MANSSSALTLISRAFSNASCLIKVIYQKSGLEQKTSKQLKILIYHLVHLCEHLIVIQWTGHGGMAGERE